MNQIATGTFIARKRRELNLTQAQLAERLGISSKSVSKWERGKCMPDYDIVNELCDALGITVSELLDGEENERENLRSAFARTRGFLLIVANARWDAEERTAGIFDDLARLFNDPKPTTARQCVQAAPALAQAQPTLVPRIAEALEGVDPGRYPDSTAPLVAADVAAALEAVRALGSTAT